jgi:hypothetical protein
VLGDDYALRRSRSYATVLIDAETGRRVDILPRPHRRRRREVAAEPPGRRNRMPRRLRRLRRGAPPRAARRRQVSDRWDLWHSPAEAVQQEVVAHSACWAGAAPLQVGQRAETPLERWRQVHDLLSRGVGLLECARRLHLALNTVNSQQGARTGRPEPGHASRTSRDEKMPHVAP